MTRLAYRVSASRPGSTRAVGLPVVSIAAIVIAGLVSQWAAAYREAPMRQLTARVQSGPNRGLFTTPQRRALIEGLSADLDALTSPSDRIRSLALPAGYYLLSRVPPASPSVWLAEACNDAVVRTWCAQTGRTPTVVVKPTESPGMPVRRRLALWGSAYVAVCVRSTYVIHRRVRETD